MLLNKKHPGLISKYTRELWFQTSKLCLESIT